LLTKTIGVIRFLLSPRIMTLNGIIAKIRPDDPVPRAITAVEASRATTHFSGQEAARLGALHMRIVRAACRS
jgi:hypothetical protein